MGWLEVSEEPKDDAQVIHQETTSQYLIADINALCNAIVGQGKERAVERCFIGLPRPPRVATDEKNKHVNHEAGAELDTT